MIGNLPAFVRQRALDVLCQKKGITLSVIGFTTSGGGCINQGGRLRTSNGDYFIKWNSASLYQGMFAAEAKGLALLKQAGRITIPDVLGYDEDGTYQFLLLEFIEGKPKSATFWEDLGIKLAALHRVSAADYGLPFDNYIGSLKQNNKLSSSWVEFLIDQRFEIQLEAGLRSGAVDLRTRKAFDKLYSKLPDLLPNEKPALLHGDLWSGNLIVDNEGNPCLIDPAVYYGHREMDLAMTRLFGGFHAAFYDSYNNSFPLSRGYGERFDICNLYPLLVHVNLFGGGYLQQINSILAKYI